MKKKFIKLLGGTLLLAFLSGCTTVNQPADALEEINGALEKNTELESATFASTITTQYETETQEVKADGMFIKNDESSYDWNHITYFEGEQASTMEVLERDGTQYERVTIPDPTFEVEWMELPEPTHDLVSKIRPLFENHFEADSVEEIEVNEADGKTYQITMKESYLEDIVTDEVAAMTEEIELLKAGGAEDFVIAAYESQLASIEQREYNSLITTYTVSPDGYLVDYLQSYSVTEPGTEPYEVRYHYELTDYNIENAEALLPEV